MIVPTFGRANIIAELLQDFAELYAQYGIDIYIYDSNDSDDTCEIVKHFMLSHENIFYKRLNPQIESNEKIYIAWQDFENNIMYDYVWLCGDATRCSEAYLKMLVPYLSQNFDILVLEVPDCKTISVYNDKCKFFKDWAWLMTGYGSVVINRSSMLAKCDWDYLSRKYLNKNTLYYSQIGLYFESLQKISEFKGAYVGNNGSNCGLYTSSLKTATGWKTNTFNVICKSWPNTINALPSDYDEYKKNVIKFLGKRILSKSYLCLLKKEKIYNLICFFKYIARWHLVSDNSYLFMFLLALVPRRFTDIICFFSVRTFIDYHKELRTFLKSLKFYEEIYLYGAGKIGKRLLDLLQSHRFKVSGFIVSYKDTETAYGYPVYDVDTMSFSENSVIILALKNDHDSIIKKLSEKVSKSQIIETNLVAVSSYYMK